jgi:hypothetical protein
VWRTIGASVIGTSHVAAETRCQDHSAYAVVERPGGDALVIAVSDGAGSAKASFHGARTAVEAAIAHLTDALAGGGAPDVAAMEACFAAARERVLAVAAEYEHEAREYASTLLVVVATSSATTVGQIGDGAIVVDDGELRAATWPQQGEYANTTHFLVDGDALERLVTAACGPARCVAVFSDGLQNLALRYDTRTPYEPFFAPFFAYLASATKPDAEVEDELRAYLDSPALNARTDDDKSLVLAVRR